MNELSDTVVTIPRPYYVTKHPVKGKYYAVYSQKAGKNLLSILQELSKNRVSVMSMLDNFSLAIETLAIIHSKCKNINNKPCQLQEKIIQRFSQLYPEMTKDLCFAIKSIILSLEQTPYSFYKNASSHNWLVPSRSYFRERKRIIPVDFEDLGTAPITIDIANLLMFDKSFRENDPKLMNINMLLEKYLAEYNLNSTEQIKNHHQFRLSFFNAAIYRALTFYGAFAKEKDKYVTSFLDNALWSLNAIKGHYADYYQSHKDNYDVCSISLTSLKSI